MGHSVLMKVIHSSMQSKEVCSTNPKGSLFRDLIRKTRLRIKKVLMVVVVVVVHVANSSSS